MLNRIIKNSLFAFISQALLLASSLGLYIIIGRILGAEGLGKFSFVLSLIGLLSFLPDLGVNLYLIREISRVPTIVREYLGHAFTLVLILAPVSYSLVILVGYNFSLDVETIRALYIGGIYLIVGAFIALFRAAFYAYERMEYDTYGVLAERVLTIVLSIIALLLKTGIPGLMMAHLLSRTCALVIIILVFRKISSLPALIFDPKVILKMVKDSLPFAINTLTTTMYVQVDIVILALWLGDSAAGYYKAATSLIIPLAIIATSLNSALFPNMARAFLSSSSQLNKLTEASMRYLSALGWPIAFGTIALSHQIITTLYGSDYQESILPLRLLAIIVPFRFINNTMGNSLTAMNRQGIRALIIILGAFLNLFLNIWLIPTWSYNGASLATVITEIVILLGLYGSVLLYIGKINLLILSLRPIICSALMAVVTFIFRDYNILIVILLSIIVYGILLALLDGIPEEIRSFLFNKFNFKKTVKL